MARLGERNAAFREHQVASLTVPGFVPVTARERLRQRESAHLSRRHLCGQDVTRERWPAESGRLLSPATS
jgi:hypothetical protein